MNIGSNGAAAWAGSYVDSDGTEGSLLLKVVTTVTSLLTYQLYQQQLHQSVLINVRCKETLTQFVKQLKRILLTNVLALKDGLTPPIHALMPTNALTKLTIAVNHTVSILLAHSHVVAMKQQHTEDHIKSQVKLMGRLNSTTLLPSHLFPVAVMMPMDHFQCPEKSKMEKFKWTSHMPWVDLKRCQDWINYYRIIFYFRWFRFFFRWL